MSIYDFSCQIHLFSLNVRTIITDIEPGIRNHAPEVFDIILPPLQATTGFAAVMRTGSLALQGLRRHILPDRSAGSDGRPDGGGLGRSEVQPHIVGQRRIILPAS